MKYDITIVLPCMRINSLLNWEHSLFEACPRHSFQILYLSPKKPPEWFLEKKVAELERMNENILRILESQNTFIMEIKKQKETKKKDILEDEYDQLTQEIMDSMKKKFNNVVWDYPKSSTWKIKI